MFLLFLLFSPAFACEGGNEDAVAENGTCVLPDLSEICPPQECVTWAEAVQHPADELYDCYPAWPVAHMAVWSYNEGGSYYYFDKDGVLVGFYGFTFMGGSCCAGEWTDAVAAGVTECSNARDLQAADSGQEDSGGESGESGVGGESGESGGRGLGGKSEKACGCADSSWAILVALPWLFRRRGRR